MQRSWTPPGVCRERLESSWVLSGTHRSEEADEQIPALWLFVTRRHGAQSFMEATETPNLAGVCGSRVIVEQTWTT